MIVARDPDQNKTSRAFAVATVCNRPAPRETPCLARGGRVSSSALDRRRRGHSVARASHGFGPVECREAGAVFLPRVRPWVHSQSVVATGFLSS